MCWTSGRTDLADSLTTLSKFTASLGEAIASGPYFKVMLVNLLPYQILQPFVDAAFKKRGIDPENFWRGAGLPAYRWPDPNGTRFSNGAPPPAPTPLEGTPDFPGPAVPAGTPCSYTPPADGIPTAADPLPCSHLGVGPFGGHQLRAAGRGDVGTEPERPRVHTGHHQRRCAGGESAGPAGRAGPAATRAAGCADGTPSGPVEPVPAVRRAAR